MTINTSSPNQPNTWTIVGLSCLAATLAGLVLFLCLCILLGTGIFWYMRTTSEATPASKPASTPAELPYDGRYIFLDFYADWCEPCKEMIPIIEELDENCPDDKINFIRLDVDDNSNKKLERHFGVNAIPRMILLDPQGKIIYDWTGSRPIEEMEALLEYCK